MEDVAGFRGALSGTQLEPYAPIFDAAAWSASTLRQADRIMKEGWSWASFPCIQLRPPLAWDDVCSHRSHAFNLHAWSFLSDVLQTYDQTRENRYLEFAIQIALDWASQYPSLKSNSDFAWYDVAIAKRAYRLAFIIDASARTPDVPDETIARLVASALLHARALSDDRRFAKHSNHGFYFAAGQLAQARRLALLPGMAKAARQAGERLQLMLRTQFTEEGGHREHSPHYHLVVLRLLCSLRQSGLLQSAEIEQLIDRTEEALAWFVLPNGRLATIGDSYPVLLAEKTQLQPNNAALRFVVSGGREGEPPPTSMRAFPDTGYVVVRSGWPSGPENIADLSYLAQIGAYHSDVHKHIDELSFIWYDRGHELLTDAGPYGYVYDDPNRRYVESTYGHNTVTVDGRAWVRRGVRTPYGAAPQRSGQVGGISYVETEVRHWDTVRHSRVLLLRSAEWLIVFDWIGDSTGALHQFSQRFLFAPGLEAEPNGSSLTLSLPGGVDQLHMVPLLPAEATIPVKGQSEPELLGWTSRRFSTMTPCWSGGYEVSDRAEHAFATLFAFGERPRQSDAELISASYDHGRHVELCWRVRDNVQKVSFSRLDGGPLTVDYRIDADVRTKTTASSGKERDRNGV